MEFIKDKLFQDRTEKASKVISNACASLNPNDEKYVAKLDAISKLYEKNVADMKAYNERLIEAEKLRIEGEKLALEAKKAEIEQARIEVERERIAKEIAQREDESCLESERIRVQEEHNMEEARHNRVSEFLLGAQIVVSAAAAVVGGYSLNQRFKRSTEKEVDEAYLTTTDKVTVQEGLKSNKLFWKLF